MIVRSRVSYLIGVDIRGEVKEITKQTSKKSCLERYKKNSYLHESNNCSRDTSW